MRCLCDRDNGSTIGIIYEHEGVYYQFVQINVPQAHLMTGWYRYHSEHIDRISFQECHVYGGAEFARDLTSYRNLITQLRQRPLETIMELLL